ncbi:hypothetical protein C8T65DRAFT_577168 [Cerioporus squamosus]|nr:hypothetical protein C8T65DRAFT_577168 [Cerioporus squamosus]
MKAASSGPAVRGPPGKTPPPEPEGHDHATHTPSVTDDQSDATTVNGDDDSSADPQKAESTIPVDESPRKDDELWFEDGNLILTTSTVQFRVYLGLLVSHSLVFRDMLSLPQPPELSPKSKCTDCVPIITLPLSDSPSDLRHFLKALTGSSLVCGALHPTYHQISAVIRMAHKYQCEALLAGGMKYMAAFYHDDFPLWQNDEAVFSPPTFERIHSIGVVNLARLVGADKWLPGALMGCCMLGAELVHGFVREDGTHETLSLEDLGRCYLGRANLVEANAMATLKLLKQTVSPTCRRPERCEQTLRHILSELTNEVNKITLINLRWDWSWTPFVDRSDVERDLCWECHRMLGKQERQKDIHREIFERLPEMMGVKVDRWGLPEPESEPEAPSDDTDDAAPDPAAVQPPLAAAPPPAPAPAPAPMIIQPPPIIIQPPWPGPPPPVQPPPHVPAGPLPAPPAMPQVIPVPAPAQPPVVNAPAAPGP